MATIPTDSIMCLALVKPGSDLHRSWSLDKPAYGIYEYDKAFCTRQLRFGDGSWQELTPEQHQDLVLLDQYGDAFLSYLFDR